MNDRSRDDVRKLLRDEAEHAEQNMDAVPTSDTVVTRPGRAGERAQLYTDLLQIGWSTLRPGTFTEGDAAFMADRLWEKGWRRQS